jgi:hypothetical protein
VTTTLTVDAEPFAALHLTVGDTRFDPFDPTENTDERHIRRAAFVPERHATAAQVEIDVMGATNDGGPFRGISHLRPRSAHVRRSSRFPAEPRNHRLMRSERFAVIVRTRIQAIRAEYRMAATESRFAQIRREPHKRSAQLAPDSLRETCRLG